MHNFALAIILTEQKRRQCPCGAVNDRPHELCRKCQSRRAWRRKTTSPRRKATRRHIGRRTRRFASFFGMEG